MALSLRHGPIASRRARRQKRFAAKSNKPVHGDMGQSLKERGHVPCRSDTRIGEYFVKKLVLFHIGYWVDATVGVAVASTCTTVRSNQEI